MKEKKNTIFSVAPEYKEAFSVIAGSKQYPMLEKFLRVQQNNLAVIEWVRVKSNDPDIVRKKAYYEGQFDFIKYLLTVFQNCKKGDENE